MGYETHSEMHALTATVTAASDVATAWPRFHPSDDRASITKTPIDLRVRTKP